MIDSGRVVLHPARGCSWLTTPRTDGTLCGAQDGSWCSARLRGTQAVQGKAPRPHTGCCSNAALASISPGPLLLHAPCTLYCLRLLASPPLIIRDGRRTVSCPRPACSRPLSSCVLSSCVCSLLCAYRPISVYKAWYSVPYHFLERRKKFRQRKGRQRKGEQWSRQRSAA